MIEVPFVPNPNGLFCAQVGMSGVLQHLDARSVPELEEIRDNSSNGEGWTLTSEIAGYLHMAGVSVEYCTTTKTQPLEDHELMPDTAYNRAKFCNALRLGIVNRNILDGNTIDQILKDGKPIIALVDFVPIQNRSLPVERTDFVGHFVTIVGSDDRNIYAHHSGPWRPQPTMPINRDLFFTAFNAPQTYHDAVIVNGWRG